MSGSIQSASYLSLSQKISLSRGNIKTIDDLFLLSTESIVRRCSISLQEVNAILDLCSATALDALDEERELSGDRFIFGTGSPILDAALGKGIQPGCIYELVGESASGKTQLALQLSLQAFPRSCIYLTSPHMPRLPTTRMAQMLSSFTHDVDDRLGKVKTLSISSCIILHNILTTILPSLLAEDDSDIGMLIVDNITELLSSSKDTIERSKEIKMISLALHELASTHNIAVIIVNQVTDSFSSSTSPYQDQVALFSRQDSKEAALGLVWANQINARIFMSRTGRRDDEGKLIRRMDVMWNSTGLSGPPDGLDYVIEESGLRFLEGEKDNLIQHSRKEDQGDEWDQYWNDDDVTEDMYYSIEMP